MCLILLLLSHFSCVRLCATPKTAAHQASLSLGFSRQEHWSGLPFPFPMHESEKWKWSRSVVFDSQWPHVLQPTRLLRPWDFPGKSTGVGCHCLLHVSDEKLAFVLFIIFICVMLLFILWVLLTFSLFFSSLTIIFLGMLLSVFIQLGVLEPYLLSTYYLFASVWVMSIELLSYWLIFYLQCINNLLV